MEERRVVLMIDESRDKIKKSFEGILIASMSALLGAITFVAIKLTTEVSTSQKVLINYSQTSVYCLITLLTVRDFYPFVPKDIESVSERTSLSHQPNHQEQQTKKDKSTLKQFFPYSIGFHGIDKDLF